MHELIAFIGVGNMGNPMAENLIKAGKKVRVFDVSNEMIERKLNIKYPNIIKGKDPIIIKIHIFLLLLKSIKSFQKK